MSRFFRLACIFCVAALALFAAWLFRQPLSGAVVARWFASQGVPASYRITALSADAVSLADVTLGAAAVPDFRAERIDAHFGWSLFWPRVDRVTIFRPVLHAVLGPHGLSLGSLDRFLPAPGAPPALLPNVDLRLVDARMTVVTRGGVLVVTGAGRGRLRGGFAGRFLLGDTQLAASACAGRLPGATFAVSTTHDEVHVIGDGAAAQLACAGRIAVEHIGWRADVHLPPKLDHYAVRLAVRTGLARAGDFAVSELDGTAEGTALTLAGPVAGTFALAAHAATGPFTSAGQVAAHGTYRFNAATGDANADARIGARKARIMLPLQPLRTEAARFAGTLMIPLVDQLAARLDAATNDFDASGSILLARLAGVTTATLTGATLTTATGARVIQTGRIALTDTAVGINGGVALSGGGLPTATLNGAGRWQGHAAAGSVTLATTRWAVPGAAVELPQVVIAARSGGVTVAGQMRVAGALGGGIVASALSVPVDAHISRNGDIVFGKHCLPVEWSSLARGDARLAAGRINLCPSVSAMLTIAGDRLQGDTIIGGMAAHGNLRSAAFALKVTPVRLRLSGTRSRPRVELAPVTLAGRLGARRGGATVAGAFDVASGSGRGRFASATLDDPASPVKIDEGAADWRLAGAGVDLAAATARISDRLAPQRFQPLRVAGGTATLVNGIVLAQGNVQLAAIKARLGRFEARHDLASGRGTARLDTGTLTFGPTLQPVDITGNLRGIVANVRGLVTGTGVVDWTATGITSRGTMHIDNLALATEALGPVDGIAGTITFDDLLALTTPPGQKLRIARINPGVVVDNGVMVFRMLGPDAAAIESIRWPYAGGILALAPVTIRAGEARRDFLLTVDGIDAQQFLQRFEIKNLNVTGRFDGRLPLVFADGKGRIAGGRLVARTGGGMVQYVGEIGSGQIGAAARLAFDALRRLRYHELTLDLDGDLDGELVTQVHFTGSNETAAALPGGPLPLKVTGLPFRFGITVRAPFRALLGTAASFSDVRPLLHTTPVLPPLVQPK